MMEPKDDFIELYVKWLKDNMKSRILETELGQYTEISTPFLDRHNDHLQIYVKRQEDGGLFLTDGGYTISDLEMCGCNVLSSQKRRASLTYILNGFGVRQQDGELCVSASGGDFAQKKHSLIQSMLAVNDMFFTAREQVLSFFVEDVQGFLDINHIPYVPNAQFSGVSGLSHTFDFTIPAMSKKPEQFIKAINDVTRDKIDSTLFSWSDIKESRKPGAQLYVMVNDSEKDMRSDFSDALISYGVHPVPWTKRKDVVEALSA